MAAKEEGCPPDARRRASLCWAEVAVTIRSSSSLTASPSPPRGLSLLKPPPPPTITVQLGPSGEPTIGAPLLPVAAENEVRPEAVGTGEIGCGRCRPPPPLLRSLVRPEVPSSDSKLAALEFVVSCEARCCC